MLLNSAEELMQRTVPKNFELCWRIDGFELWCWRRLLRVPGTARRSNQSILKEIRLEYSLEGLMLKLKFQYFSHLIRRTDLLKKTLMLGNIEGGGEGEQQEKGTTQDEMSGWHLQINGHEFEQAPGVGDGQRSLVCCSPCGRKELDTTEWLNWTEKITNYYAICFPILWILFIDSFSPIIQIQDET